jgi:L,D-peptidoglycan transpeptidase YkuD (ErfK/YbiS/YcfS/YnhG family)
MVVARWQARFMGRRFPVSIGRGAMMDAKQEGDMATPRGIWRIVGGAYRSDRVQAPRHARALPFHIHPIGLRDIWSDDPDDANYNHGLTAHNYHYSHEKMRLAARLYDVVLMSDWNWPDAQPGKGSAIFIHQWRKPRHPTAGCLAFHPQDLRWILDHWTPQSRIIVR